MRNFKDTAGRSWFVDISVDTVRRIKNTLHINLMDIFDGEVLQKLATDPILLCDMLYVVCKPDADKLGISEEDFAKALGGDVLEQAINAFLEALVDFFPPQRRKVLAKALKKMNELEEKVFTQAEKMLGQQMDDKINETLKSFTASSSS